LELGGYRFVASYAHFFSHLIRSSAGRSAGNVYEPKETKVYGREDGRRLPTGVWLGLDAGSDEVTLWIGSGFLNYYYYCCHISITTALILVPFPPDVHQCAFIQSLIRVAGTAVEH
jgi:hypothetical protein